MTNSCGCCGSNLSPLVAWVVDFGLVCKACRDDYVSAKHEFYETAFDWLYEQIGEQRMAKGLEIVEKTRELMEPEAFIAMHHQIVVNTDLKFAASAVCPDGLDKSIYSHRRAQERVDHYARPTLRPDCRWG